MALSTLQILALKSFAGIGNKTVTKVAKLFSGIPDNAEMPALITRAGLKKKGTDGKKTPITAEDFHEALLAAQEQIKQSNAQGIGILSFWEERFPNALRDTMTEDGKKSDPPLLLFYKGDLALLQMPALAVIGTRDASENALKAGTFLAKQFAEKGFVIVSGLALGCDTAAHEGALAAVNGKTVAVLGNGLDTVYPAKNKTLAQEILARGGLLLSEYEFGTPATRFTLVARDRLQASLSDAALVIQTSVDGGTMHAARATAAARKPLYAVKYTDEATNALPQTAGNRLLVDEHGAQYLAADPDRTVFNRRLNEITAHILETINTASKADTDKKDPTLF